MSAKPSTVGRDWAIARIARALGCAGYSVEECDAIMAWVQAGERPGEAVAPRPCGACGGSGHVDPLDPVDVKSGRESIDGMDLETRMLVQGVCLACRGRGRFA